MGNKKPKYTLGKDEFKKDANLWQALVAELIGE